MNVSLTPELEAYVGVKVKSGQYRSPSEVVHEALLALQAKEEAERKRAALVADLEEGLASLRAGEGVPMTPELLEAMKSEGRKRLAQRGANGVANG